MKETFALGCLSLCLIGIRVSGQRGDPPPAWAYPQAPPGTQRPPDDGKVYRLEGSTAGFTATQINDPFAPPDWYPNEHPPMPETVAHGRKPDLRACGQCHLPHGLGHPESSGIAGLPADYIVEQMRAYRDGRRKSSVGNSIMIPLSEAEGPWQRPGHRRAITYLPCAPALRLQARRANRQGSRADDPGRHSAYAG